MQNNDLAGVQSLEYLNGLITETQAAELLGYTIRALQNWRVRGGGPKFVKVSAKSIRYRRRDLFDWIEARIQSNTSQSLSPARPLGARS